ncbi:MAG: zinc-binding dehydrogenase [Thermoflavifilum sp.]|nr:zinc-binding dehydrogenase [Thermoflavifilum sp.]
MKAVIIEQFGSVDQLKLIDMPRPEPGSGELLIRNLAISVNPVDAKIRANGTWAQITLPAILGYDAAGVVEAVGDHVSDFRLGDEVFYTPSIHGNSRGTYAEFTVVPAAIVAHKPQGISFEEAAAIPLAGGTAWEAIVRRLQVKPGETVLITAAAGGVGSFAVQFARIAGARVIATASEHHHDFVKQIGADAVFDYHQPDFHQQILAYNQGQRVDAAFDIQGNPIIGGVLDLVRPFGRLACILPPAGNLSPLYHQNQTLYGIFLTRERKRLEEMRPLFEWGKAKAWVEEVMPFSVENLRKAHERMDQAHGRGKIVLKF